MLGTLLVTLFGAGCFSDHGVVIEVDVGNTGATSVELFLGKTSCPESNAAGIDCVDQPAHIAPPGAAIPLTGTITFRDPGATYYTTTNGSKATFRLEVDPSGDTTLPIVIAVGLASDGTRGTATLKEVVVPMQGARVIPATLEKATTLDPATDGTDQKDHVLVWDQTGPRLVPEQDSPPACVVVEHWAGGSATRDFIVPADDPDCDGFPVRMECDPAAFKYTTPAGMPNCVVLDMGVGGACKLGSRGCSDGMNTDTCHAQTEEVCVPDAFCDCTGVDCMQHRVTQMDIATTTRIECTLPARPTNELCPGEATAHIDLNSVMDGAQCGPLGIGTRSSILVDGFMAAATFDSATIAISAATSSCDLAFTWTQGTFVDTSLNDALGLVRITVADAGKLVLPVVFHFGALACGSNPTCSLLPKKDAGNGGGSDAKDDKLWTCANNKK